MYEFLDRLSRWRCHGCVISAAFSGRSFDGAAISLRLREQIVFPEIDYDRVDAGAWDERRRRHHGANRRGS